MPIYRARAAGSSRTSCAIPRAPNGTAELLIDAAMRALADEGSALRDARAGAAVRAGAPAGCARRARCRRALYDFDGLRAFKAKLRPHAWEPIYLAHPPGSSSHVALVDALAAFARGSFLRFGVETLLRGPAMVVRVLAALLVPWTVLLALARRALVPVRRGCRRRWVGFDVRARRRAVRADAALAPLARRRAWRAPSASTRVLTPVQVALYDAPRVHGARLARRRHLAGRSGARRGRAVGRRRPSRCTTNGLT